MCKINLTFDQFEQLQELSEKLNLSQDHKSDEYLSTVLRQMSYLGSNLEDCVTNFSEILNHVYDAGYHQNNDDMIAGLSQLAVLMDAIKENVEELSAGLRDAVSAYKETTQLDTDELFLPRAEMRAAIEENLRQPNTCLLVGRDGDTISLQFCSLVDNVPQEPHVIEVFTLGSCELANQAEEYLQSLMNDHGITTADK